MPSIPVSNAVSTRDHHGPPVVETTSWLVIRTSTIAGRGTVDVLGHRLAWVELQPFVASSGTSARRNCVLQHAANVKLAAS